MLTFENNQYETREVNLTGFGWRTISTTNLSEKLMDENCTYLSKDACSIDEKIFFYVSENEIKLPVQTLSNLILNQIQ